MIFFLKGAILGFFIAAPVGPIGLLCIQRTLARGMAAGIVSGLGTALADTLYCAVAVFGMTVIAGFLQDNQFYLNLTGGIALIYLGCYTFRSQLAEAAPTVIGDSLFSAFVSAFFLTLTNPLMILSFATVFAGIGLGAVGADYRATVLFICGVFTGSSTAWLSLSGMVSAMRTKFSPKRLRVVNLLSGMLIVGLGVFCLINVFTK
jgi:threonine/homoserine/homoserine lactone efflux protein